MVIDPVILFLEIIAEITLDRPIVNGKLRRGSEGVDPAFLVFTDQHSVNRLGTFGTDYHLSSLIVNTVAGVLDELSVDKVKRTGAGVFDTVGVETGNRRTVGEGERTTVGNARTFVSGHTVLARIYQTVDHDRGTRAKRHVRGGI